MTDDNVEMDVGYMDDDIQVDDMDEDGEDLGGNAAAVAPPPPAHAAVPLRAASSSAAAPVAKKARTTAQSDSAPRKGDLCCVRVAKRGATYCWRVLIAMCPTWRTPKCACIARAREPNGVVRRRSRRTNAKCVQTSLSSVSANLPRRSPDRYKK